MHFTVGTQQIAVNIADLAGLKAVVLARLAARQGFALATLNLDHLVKLGSDASFRTAYGAQDLVTADGNPVVWMARLAGEKIDLLPGADLILPLLHWAAEAKAPVALVGTTADSLAGAAQGMTRAVPGLHIVAQIAPPMGFDPGGSTAEALLDRVQGMGAALCVVALGAPKQEIFAAHGRRRTPGIGFVSIGAGLDFLSGQQMRAPRWVRRIAMEWLWRMASNPRRLALRYLRCALVLPGHMWASWRQRPR